MAVIRVLDRHVAELIAAGEVVERPSSVIKELVENSIDAGSTAITVEVQRGGVTYLRITDNGCGIAREDVPTAFLRHATSKVRTQEDLDQIGTLGFRGEALASVAAVSRVDLLTKTADEDVGTRYRIEGGEEIDRDDAGCPTGTTLIVRDLFYNTPARMKFLKKDVAEANAAADVVDRIALTHPEISFRFIRDGKETLHTPGDGRLFSAVHAVYGKEFAAGLIPVEYAHAGVTMDGFISKPSAARANRNMQHFIVNGRFVRTKTAMAALSEGYKNSIMVGKFPACVLRFSIPADQVDVNVHPAKIEVRFVQEKTVFDTVYFGVKAALAQRDSRPAMELPQKKILPPSPPPAKPLSLFDVPSKEAAPAPEAAMPTQSATPPVVKEQVKRVEPIVSVPPRRQTVLRGGELNAYQGLLNSLEKKPEEEKATTPEPQPQPAPIPVAEPAEKEAEKPTEVPVEKPVAMPAEKPTQPELFARLLGEAFATYAVVEVGEELLFIDKHAAHERILFDRLMANRAHPRSQLLLEPAAVTLSKEEYSALLEHLEEVQSAGFDISDFGSGTVLARSVPMELPRSDVALLVQEIAGKFIECQREVSLDHLEWIYHSVACRAAVKAGDTSGREELLALARRICADQSVMYCPHGRPVAIRLTKREIEKQFGRMG